MYWTSRTRSFLPRPVQVRGTAFSPYVAYVGTAVAYGMVGSLSEYVKPLPRQELLWESWEL
eukprot:scaffold338394_cov55-Attheya_sp.AAC.1